MIIQSQRCRIVDGIPRRDIAFTLPQADANLAQKILLELSESLGLQEVVVNNDVAKVSDALFIVVLFRWVATVV